MAVFEMIKYHNQIYPSNIPLRIEECSANFDVKSVESTLDLSLHTEYSYGKRKMDSNIVLQYPNILNAQKNEVPQLWKDENWACEFAHFLFDIADNRTPKIIEIHPPFTDYSDFNIFIKNYRVFENIILDKYPNVEILIENRCGSVYNGGKFLISKNQDIYELCDNIEKSDLKLKIAYDIPQIYTANNVKSSEQYLELLEDITNYRTFIGGVHLWGKRKSQTGRRVAHCGDLNSYFENDIQLKKEFLICFNSVFSDGIVRKMVLEVNSGNEDLVSIVNDLLNTGIEFI